jgi:hypothetical protein
MHPGIAEKDIRCPHCGEPLTILLDLSAGTQSYVEDCQVCCRPMLVNYDVTAGELGEVRIDGD